MKNTLGGPGSGLYMQVVFLCRWSLAQVRLYVKSEEIILLALTCELNFRHALSLDPSKLSIFLKKTVWFINPAFPAAHLSERLDERDYIGNTTGQIIDGDVQQEVSKELQRDVQ